MTISEAALYGWNSSPMQTAQLHPLSRRKGVTIPGADHQDVYWVSLISMVLAAAHLIETVTGKTSWNADGDGPEVANDQRVNRTVEDLDTWLPETARSPSFGKNTLGALVEDLGMTVTEQSSTTRPEIAERTVHSKALGLTVAPGRVIGFTDVDTVRTDQGITFTFDMTERLYYEGEAGIIEWTVTGGPSQRLTTESSPSLMIEQLHDGH